MQRRDAVGIQGDVGRVRGPGFVGSAAAQSCVGRVFLMFFGGFVSVVVEAGTSVRKEMVVLITLL